VANYKFGIYEPPHKRWPVAWYNPAVLLRSAREMVATGDFIRNFDRRELFTGDLQIVDQSSGYQDGDFWWDFMSDSGDGGNASYSVARAMQSPYLAVGIAEGVQVTDIGDSLPGGALLVLGGDLAYPGASTEEYQYRFIEMWEAAKPNTDRSPLTVVSIPQNHDWFDNISSFSRHFVGEYSNHFLQAHTPQNRSYFATRLPHNWWILGFDFALVGDLDRPQYEAFLNLFKLETGKNPTPDEAAKKPIHRDHNVILVYPEPYWTRPLGDDAGVGYPKRYQRLEAELLNAGVKIRLRIAGDLHHYVREAATTGAHLNYEDLLVTCGTGGAFLHPTHAKRVTKTKILDRILDSNAMTPDLEKRVCVGLQSVKNLNEDQRQYEHQASYPSRKTSKRLSYWNLVALFKPASLFGLFADEVEGTAAARAKERFAEVWRGITMGNIMFPLLLGFLYLLAVYCNSFVFSKSFEVDGFIAASKIGDKTLLSFIGLWFKALFFSPLALGVHIVLLGLCGSIAHEDGPHSFLLGMFNGTIHILAAATLFWIGSYYELNDYAKGITIFAGGVVAGGLLFGIYFSLVARFGGLANNGFSPIAHQGYKGFLRFRIDKNGNLHGYMIGTDAVPQRWVTNPAGKRPLWIERPDQDAPEWKVRDAFTLTKK
jgi:hypothetical protein